MRCSNLTHALDLSNRFWKYEKKIGAIRKKYVMEDRQVCARTAREYTNNEIGGERKVARGMR